MYGQHIIFSLHFHSFLFLCFLFLCLLGLFNPSLHGWLVIGAVFLVTLFIYLVAALHNVYEQSIWLSALKGIAISVIYFITLFVTMCIFMALVFVLI